MSLTVRRSNKSRVLSFLSKSNRPSLSTAQARSFFGIKNVSPVIEALRNQGYPIGQTSARRKGKTVTVYALASY